MTPPHLAFKTVLRCSNFARSRDFYTRVLGFTPVEEWSEPQGQGCILSPFPTAEPCLEIYAMTPLDPRFHASFAQPLSNDKIDLQIRTASIDAWVDKLRGLWEFDGPEDLPWGQRWIKLRDPDRLLIAIYQERRS